MKIENDDFLYQGNLIDVELAAVEKNLQLMLEHHQQPDSQKWAELLAKQSPSTRLALLQKLLPQAFVSEKAHFVHQGLQQEYPELLSIIDGTTSFFTAFPSAGIPAQSKAITAAGVTKDFNAGIGVARDEDGNVLMNPELCAVFDLLQPSTVSDSDWLKLRNQIFNYNDGLGAPWYRELARLRYLSDGQSNSALQASMYKSLRIKPLPVYGGTTALSIAFDVAVGAACPLLFPSTYWDNMDLKAEHQVSRRGSCDYIDRQGHFHPEELRRYLRKLRQQGFAKAAVYFNFPHNPTGTIPAKHHCEQFQEVIQSAADTNFKIVIVCDEPYYPFVRGREAVLVPFSYYMQPGENRNILTFVNINGTKRDGVYGLRHSDLIVLTPTTISAAGIGLLEKEILAGYMRGTFSFSNALSQYLLARAMSSDPLIPLKKDNFSISEAYLAAEKKIISNMAIKVQKLEKILAEIKELVLVRDEAHDCAGGFFLSYRLGKELENLGLCAEDIQQAALKVNCGIVATGGYIRINALINEQTFSEFAANLRQAIDMAKAKYYK